MEHPYQPDDETQILLASLKDFCFPGGEDAARRVRAVKTRQKGEMRSAPGARWIPFTADERIDATRSSFCWEARYDGSKFGSLMVTDAYEEGHGRLVVKLGGLIQVKKFSGPDFDKGEIQRYFSSMLICPSMLLNHPSLQFSTAGKRILRVQDSNDPTGAAVEFEIGESGRPLICRAERPRLVGRRAIPTRWSGVCSEIQEWEGLRVARIIEVSWCLPENAFVYYRSEFTSHSLVA